MSKKSKPQVTTTTQTQAPPAYIAPYLSNAAQAATNLYGQGNYIAPVQQSAIDYSSNVLGGNYLNSNPWLDATFNKAAGAVTNQVQSNFGLAGRNARGPDAAAAAQYGPAGAGGGYDDLAASIYGGNYQAERERQQQLVPQAAGLGYLSDPSRALNQYVGQLGQLSGGYGTSSGNVTTPTQRNVLGGILGGAQAGSAFGPWGMLGGGILGGVFSDRRLKRNIKRIGVTKRGTPFYSFDYIWGQKSAGVMSDEAPRESVSIHPSGFELVDYARA